MLGFALLFALILDSGVIHRVTIFRLGFFLPIAVPSVVAALMWGYFYGQSFGPIAQIFTALKLPPPAFLTPPNHPARHRQHFHLAIHRATTC